MILDSLDNIAMYEAVSPYFAKAIEFIRGNCLDMLPLGRNEILGDKVYANVFEVQPKSKEEARIEIHRRYIDIQVPVTGDEVMGYTPLEELPAVEFVESDDAGLYPAGLAARDYFSVKRGQFVIFFPQDGHAPAITPAAVKKVVVKVAAE